MATVAVDPRTDYLLRLGDDALVLGQRVSEWCGHGPVLEVDISLANLALDLIGQSRLLLTHAAALEGQGRDEDQLAFLRREAEFRNLTIVELPNGDLLVADMANQRVRRVTPLGVVTTEAGGGDGGYEGARATMRFNFPRDRPENNDEDRRGRPRAIAAEKERLPEIVIVRRRDRRNRPFSRFGGIEDAAGSAMKPLREPLLRIRRERRTDDRAAGDQRRLLRRAPRAVEAAVVANPDWLLPPVTPN